MDTVVEACAGLDVHKDTVAASYGTRSLRRASAGGPHVRDHHQRAARLRDWLVAHASRSRHGVHRDLLAARVPRAGGRARVLGAERPALRNVPGARPTSGTPSDLPAHRARPGRPSFVPPKPIRELRNLTRTARPRSRERTGRSSAWTRSCRTRGSSSPPLHRHPGARAGTCWPPWWLGPAIPRSSPNSPGGTCDGRSRP